MSERNKHIDDLFRDALGDHTETPPPAVWDALEQRLDNDDDGGRGGGSGNNKPVFPYRWLWYIGALLLLVAAGVTVWSVTRNASNVAPENKVTPASVQQPAAPAANDVDDSDADANDDNSADDATNNNSVDNTDNSNIFSGSNNNTSNNTPNGRNTNSDNDRSADNPKSNSNKSDGRTNSGSKNRSNTAVNADNDNTQAKTQTNTPTNTKQTKQNATAKTLNQNNTAPQQVTQDVPQTPDNKPDAVSKANDQPSTANNTKTNNTPTKPDAVDPKVQKTASNDDETAPKAQDQNATADNKTKTQKANTADEPKDAVAKTQSKKENTVTSDPPKKEEQAAPKAQSDAVAKADNTKAKTDVPKPADNKKTTDEPEQVKQDEPKPQDQQPKPIDKKADDGVAPKDDKTAKKEPKKDDETVAPKDDEQQQVKADDKQNDDAPAVAKQEAPKAKQQKQRKADDLSAPPVTVDEEDASDNILDSAALDPFNNGGDLTANGDFKDKAKRKKGKVIKDKDDAKGSSRFEGGLNLGYEIGFNTNRADKYVIAPYVQYNISDKSSLLFQPAYLMGMVKLKDIASGEDIYYNVTNSGYDSSTVFIPGDTAISPQAMDTIIANYTYRRTYDSTVVSRVVSTKQLWDMELPLMYQYKVSPNFSVFGGVSMTISKTLSITDSRQDFVGFKDSTEDQWIATYPKNGQAPTPPAAQDPNSFFTNTGSPISSYQPAGSSGTTTNTMTRWGYTIGFRATVKERFLIGASLQQKQVNTNIITDPRLQKIYTQPYVRVTVGFKLFK